MSNPDNAPTFYRNGAEYYGPVPSEILAEIADGASYGTLVIGGDTWEWD